MCPRSFSVDPFQSSYKENEHRLSRELPVGTLVYSHFRSSNTVRTSLFGFVPSRKKKEVESEKMCVVFYRRFVSPHREKNEHNSDETRSKEAKSATLHLSKPSRTVEVEEMQRKGEEVNVASCYFVTRDTPLREGGGEPSLEYYEDLYGSLRMPLSIWVILRIYNEDAMQLVRPSLSRCPFDHRALGEVRRDSRHREARIGQSASQPPVSC